MDTSTSILLKQIDQHIICANCEEEFQAGSTDISSLQNYTKLCIRFPDFGIQVWCRRHDANVVHVNFNGQKFKADFQCLETK